MTKKLLLVASTRWCLHGVGPVPARVGHQCIKQTLANGHQRFMQTLALSQLVVCTRARIRLFTYATLGCEVV